MKRRIDGPRWWKHASALLLRGAVVVTPLVAIAGGIAATSGQSAASIASCFLGTALLVGGLVLVSFLLVPGLESNDRRLRSLSLAGTELSQPEGSTVLAWTGTLLTSSGRHFGSLHFFEGKFHFLLHRPVRPGKAIDEQVLEFHASSVRAVEREAAPAGVWFWLGRGIVAILLRDGREVRLATWDPDGLAETLQLLVDKPEGTPAGAPLDIERAPTKEIAALLARRHAVVALVAQDPGEPPVVVLQGNAEALAGALDLARQALLVEKKDALAPYLEARKEKPPEKEKA